MIDPRQRAVSQWNIAPIDAAIEKIKAANEADARRNEQTKSSHIREDVVGKMCDEVAKRIQKFARGYAARAKMYESAGCSSMNSLVHSSYLVNQSKSIK